MPLNTADQPERMRPRRWRLRWSLAMALGAGLIGAFGWSALAAWMAPTEADAVAIEAAMLRNFARYVTWPATSFRGERDSWHVCVLGQDPFGDTLDKTLVGRSEQERTFEITRLDTVDQATPCHILFVAYANGAKRRLALLALNKRPILTVSDAPGFLSEGGIVQFEVLDRVEMRINLDQSRAAALKISAKLLEVSREVLDNGVLRRRR
jgi:hypothetical protein